LFDIEQIRSGAEQSEFGRLSVEQLSDRRIFSESDMQAQRDFLAQLPALQLSFPPAEAYVWQLKIAKDRAEQQKVFRDNILLSLYTHDDYFSSYQTANMIFFGKIFELVVTSFFHRFADWEVRAFLDLAPFHSFFHYFPNKAVTQETNEQEQPIYYIKAETMELPEQADEELGFGNAGEDSTAGLETIELGFTKEEAPGTPDVFAQRIQQWHDEYANADYSAQLIYSAFNKYFVDVQQLKGLSFIGEQSVWTLHQRVKYILLNAFASFESENKNTVKQNIAMAEDFSPENIELYDQSYLQNIKPLLNRNTVTHAINNHPVFQLDGLKDFTIWRTVVVDKPESVESETGSEQALEAKVAVPEQTKARSKASSKGSPKAPPQTKGQSNVAAKARAALQTVVTREEIESLRNTRGDEKSLYLIRDIVGRIVRSEEMAKFKAEYLRQKQLSRSYFYVIYQAAQTFGRDGMLDAWLAGKL
jgi:hypothetical protein